MAKKSVSAEFGVRNSEVGTFNKNHLLPHSAFCIPHSTFEVLRW